MGIKNVTLYCILTCIRQRLEEIRLPLHVVTFPQWKSVKVMDVHAKDVKERIWGKVALQKKETRMSNKLVKLKLIFDSKNTF